MGTNPPSPQPLLQQSRWATAGAAAVLHRITSGTRLHAPGSEHLVQIIASQQGWDISENYIGLLHVQKLQSDLQYL